MRRQIKHQYKISLEAYDAILARPCAICGRKAVVLDHDQETGVLREGLCQGCNLGLGHAKDDPAILRRMAEYLEKHRG